MAAKLNECRQKATEAREREAAAKTALNELLDQQTTAKATYAGFLEKQARGQLADSEKDALAKAEADAKAFDGRLSAARKLVVVREDETEAAAAAEAAALAQDETDKRAVRSGAGRIEVTEDQRDKWAKDPKRGFKDHREFFGAVMHAGRGGRPDERLKPLATQGSDEQGAYSDPAGGYLVPHGVAPGILSLDAEGDVLAPYVTKIPMTAPTVTFNARVDKNHSTSVSGGFTVTRRPETGDGSSSRMTFEQVTLTANEEFGLAFASERILQDSPISFVAIIQAGFASEYAAFAMEERLWGGGTGERLGLMNAPAKVEIAKETGQAAATITKTNIDKMAARCWRYEQAVWIASRTTRVQLKSLVQVVGTGGNAVPYFVAEGGMPTLDGRPLFFTERAAALGTVGDLVLANLSEYLEGQYQGEQYAESIHVRFAAAERAFRFYRRTDGRPWWSSVLTPKRGDTLAPIVTLATRA